jgi:hypothetical protein
VKKNDWPPFTEEEPEVYEREDLDTLFRAAVMVRVLLDDRDARAGSDARLLGRREPQGVHSEGHPQAASRLDAEGLQGARDSHPGAADRIAEDLENEPQCPCELLFPTSGCNPKLDFLDCLKAFAERADLIPAIIGCTSSVRRSRRGICGPASICGACNSGSDTRTWRARCAT